MSWDNWKSGEPNGLTNGRNDEGWFIFMNGIIYQLKSFCIYQLKKVNNNCE